MEDGFNDGDRLEVSLVHRNGLANTDAIFFAEVRGVGTIGGRRFLDVWHEENIKETIYLDAYFLLSITWKPDRMIPLDSVGVETSPEAQSDGYEVICHILEQAGIKEQTCEKEPEVKKARIGPRRVEAKLVQKTHPFTAVEVVVLEYHPPKGPFKYHTLKGRPWNTTAKKLESIAQTYHGSDWWISNVVKHLSPGQSTSSFHGEMATEGWGRIEEFLGTMKSSEINVLRHFKWQQGSGDEEDLSPGRWNHSRNHMGGVPGHYRNPYKPTAVFFRVSGDEVGKKAFLVQAEKQVQACPDPPTLEEFLEKTEKKAVAGDASDSKETSSAVSARTGNVSGGHETNTDVHDDNGAGSPSGDAGASALPAHDPELDSLEDDVGLPFGTVPYIPGLEGAAHSAIERCLRAALYRPGKRKKRTLH